MTGPVRGHLTVEDIYVLDPTSGERISPWPWNSVTFGAALDWLAEKDLDAVLIDVEGERWTLQRTVR